MALARRLARLDVLLSPTQLVLRWLDEAHAFGSLDAYVSAILDLPADEQPINRLCREARDTVRDRFGPRRGDDFQTALRGALRQTVFRFELVIRANEIAHDLNERSALLAMLFASQMALLGSTGRRVDDAFRTRRFATLRDNCFASIDEQLSTQSARTTVEARYFEGRPIVFPGLAAAIADQLRRRQELAVMSDTLGGDEGVRQYEGPDRASMTQIEAQSLADLMEPARATALDKLGEDDRAIAVAVAWLQPKLAARSPERWTP